MKPLLLQLVLAVLSAGCAFLATRSVWLASEGWGWAALGIFVWAPLAWGTWRANLYAVFLVRLILWFGLALIPLGVIHPLTAMEWPGEPPSALWLVVRYILPWAAPTLVALFVLSKYKAAWFPEPGA